MTKLMRVGALMLALWKKIGKGFTQRRKEGGAGVPKTPEDQSTNKMDRMGQDGQDESPG